MLNYNQLIGQSYDSLGLSKHVILFKHEIQQYIFHISRNYIVTEQHSNQNRLLI